VKNSNVCPVELMIITTGLQTGGAERMLVKLLTRIDRVRFAPVVISLTGRGTQGEHLSRLGIECVYPGRRGLAGLASLLWSAARRIERSNGVLLQGWMYHGCLFAAVLHWLTRGRARLLWGIRHSIHDLAKETRSVRLILRALAWLSPRVALCVYPSKVAAAQHANLGISCRNTEIVANGFELDRFTVPDPQNRSRARERFGLAADECVIVHVARYHPMKDHSGLLHAFAAALRRVPTLRLLMAGQGVVVQNPSLAALTDQLDVSRQVTLLGELSDVREVLAAGDGFCLSSKWGEAFPNAVGEAMAMGLPAICTDVGECREIVGAAGWVLPAGDPSALADAMAQLAGLSAEERGRIGAQARERVEQRYDLGKCVAAYERLYAAQLAQQ